MSALQIIVPLGLAALGLIIAIRVRNAVRLADFRHGQAAFLNGLPLNPRWSQDCKDGWSDALRNRLIQRSRAQRRKEQADG